MEVTGFGSSSGLGSNGSHCIIVRTKNFFSDIHPDSSLSTCVSQSKFYDKKVINTHVIIKRTYSFIHGLQIRERRGESLNPGICGE